jgi:YggT family protein
MILFIRIINLVGQILTILVIVKVVLSYFMNPYHPLRQTIDQIVEPMLDPIRRVIPTMGMIDFSPIVLIILIQIVTQVLTSFLFNIVR